MNKTLVKAGGIRKSYLMGRTPLRVLRGASLDVRQGEMLAIMGSSGSGKSTLLHILGALDTPDEGQVQIDGQDVFTMTARRRDALRNREIGFVFQFYHLLPELSVLENVLMPRMVGSSVAGWLGRRHAARRRAGEILELVGLADRAQHRPNELSGGERQRVAIARAMVNGPRLLLADEPTGNLDATMGMEILQILRSLNDAGQTIILVTHDAAIAERADRIVRLVDGRIQT